MKIILLTFLMIISACKDRASSAVLSSPQEDTKKNMEISYFGTADCVRTEKPRNSTPNSNARKQPNLNAPSKIRLFTGLKNVAGRGLLMMDAVEESRTLTTIYELDAVNSPQQTATRFSGFIENKEVYINIPLKEENRNKVSAEMLVDDRIAFYECSLTELL